MLPEELLELAQKLSCEKLFIQTEQKMIIHLNDDVSMSAAQMCKIAWLVRQHKINLSKLTSDGAAICCRRANLLDATNFVDAFHHLNYHESKFSTFLKLLRDEPNLLVEFLCNIPSSCNISVIIDAVVTSIYGACLSPYDEAQVGYLLMKLCENLMSSSSSLAERLLTKDKCMWCLLYRAYTECMLSSKLFLTAALYQPVINLLSLDDWYYDIEPNKVLERFPPRQRVDKFGQPGTEAFRTKTQHYRKTIVRQLYKFTISFIDHIKQAMVCFPYPLRWLISHVNKILKSTQRYQQTKAKYICTELIFDLFICPAIIDPMMYGLTSDVTVSRIARHNLMQVARILQVLSKGQYSDEIQRIPDLYTLFDQDCLTNLADDIMDTAPTETLAMSYSDQFNKCAILVGTEQLDTLVHIFKEVLGSLPEQSILRQRTEATVKSLPSLKLNNVKDTSSLTPSHSPATKPKRKTIKKLGGSTDAPDSTVSSLLPSSLQDVIMINIEDTEPIGLQEEEKVLASVEYSRESTARIDGAMKKTRFYLAQDQESIGSDDDDMSACNASEYQASELADAISEAASVRSERSTNLDDTEDVDDNLSDMVSANVSGKGSPNISGRETPQSVDDGGGAGDVNPSNLPVTVPKPNGDLTDRFGKFAIETPVARSMDMRSLVSDSWSIDVNPSDTETVENHQETPLLPGVISETASESAWSVDVLNSDTSERQTERLQEVEQMDEPYTNADQESESDRMSTRSTDSRRGEPTSPFDPVRNSSQCAVSQPFSFNHQQTVSTNMDIQRLDLDRTSQPPGALLTNQQQLNFATSRSTNLQVINQMVLPVNQPKTHQTASSNTSPNIEILTPQPVIMAANSNQNNVLDMFDPLAESASTVTTTNEWISLHNRTLNVCSSKSAWSSFNHQSAFKSQTDNTEQHRWPPQADVWQNQDPWSVPAVNTNNTAALNQQSVESWSHSAVRPRTWNNTSAGANTRHTVTPANRWAMIDEDQDESEDRPQTWSTLKQTQSTASTTNTLQSTNHRVIITTTVTSNNTAGGAIPKKSLPRTLSQGSNEDTDNIILPGKKLGKERKPLISSSIKKPKRVKGSTLKQADRASPAISEPREEVTSSASDDSGKQLRAGKTDKVEETEDILEKYRTPNKLPSKTNSTHSFSAASLSLVDDENDVTAPIYDEDNLEKCLAFTDAKKKLRIVLSTSSLYSLLLLTRHKLEGATHAILEECSCNFLVVYLRILYAEAIMQQNLQLITQLQETLRCLQRFNNSGCYKLIKALKEEYQARVHYISYLAKSRQRLLGMQTRIQGAIETLSRDKENCFDSLILECVRMFLDCKSPRILRLTEDFSKLQSPDEKAAEVEKCLDYLHSEVDRDEMWKFASDVMRDAAQVAIERSLMERIYNMAMFPNGDGDTQRDKIFHESVLKLSAVVTPKHRQLRIPSIYHLECPWGSAQAHITKINAFKTPRDKVQCICRCADTIMRLLRLAHTKSVPGADDFFPVFVYVLVMANPPFLLSNIQYVDSLYETRMEGEEAYNWGQLKAAVDFIKMWLQEETIQVDSTHL